MNISAQNARQGVTSAHHPISRVLLVSMGFAVICLGVVTFLT